MELVQVGGVTLLVTLSSMKAASSRRVHGRGVGAVLAFASPLLPHLAGQRERVPAVSQYRLPGQLAQVFPQDVAGHDDLLWLLAMHPDVEDLEHELVEGHQVSQCSPLG